MTITIFSKTILKILLTVSPLRLISNLILRRYLNSLSDDSIMMICTGGIGDTVISCLLIDSFNERYRKRNCKFLIKKGHESIVKYLQPNAEINIISNKMLRCIELSHKPIKTPVHGIHSRYIYGELSIFDELHLYNGSFIEDFKYKIFGLEKSVKLKQVSNRSTDQKVLQNKILLAPETVSINYEENILWDILTDELIKKGFEVYTNTINGNVVKGTKKLSVSLIELKEVLKDFRLIISYRSGLNDWLEVLGIKQIILYPSQKTCKYYDTSLMYNTSNTINLVINTSQEDFVTTLLKEVMKGI